MSNPVIHAFFLGRAFAEVLSEKLEDTLTNALSDLGQFDAQAREHLRQLIEEVQAKAEREMAQGTYSGGGNNASPTNSEDLQETIDELRAEIASLRSQLKDYRNQTV